ncbi:glycosyltransferase [Bordetella petrii]|uniref:glycosyltransferase n=1 Tax=Bordetella petrii TaxID=94624 RepID=UPI001A9756F8|nr:glycosyltransferase family 4 protein [Bordetella petrii]MBO1113773.1 glycosyltransferase family 4 protein [Bordetella petrii]
MTPHAEASGGARRLRILVWHVHGNYLYSLTQAPHDFYVPQRGDGRPGYGPLGRGIPWGPNVHGVPAGQVKDLPVDLVLYQSGHNLADAPMLLSQAQRRLPCAYIEHNPPAPLAAETVHAFRHERGLLVHVTPYNAVMWDAGGMPQQVVEHGVVDPGPLYRGDLARGIVVVNHLARRGRRVGADLYADAARHVPLDLIGMGSEEMAGGLGEVSNMEVAAFMARYRCFFSPVRYASLGLSLVEAMLCGLPVVGFAATELPCVITSGRDGYVDTRPHRLHEAVRQLLHDPALAREWGQAGRRTALRRFAIERFVADWNRIFATLTEAS